MAGAVASTDALVISPHLDDAVLSIGAWISSFGNPIVATVFAGDPGAQQPASEWDRDTARTAAGVVATRQAEDKAALETLRAELIHLHYLEAPFRRPTHWHESRQGAGDLFAQLRSDAAAMLNEFRPGALVVPVGTGHIDHLLANCATISAWLTERPCPLYAYAEQPYQRFSPSLTEWRLRRLRASSLPVEFEPTQRERQAKREAVSAYRSQLRPLEQAFGGWRDGLDSEVIWQLSYDEGLGQEGRPANQDGRRI